MSPSLSLALAAAAVAAVSGLPALAFRRRAAAAHALATVLAVLAGLLGLAGALLALAGGSAAATASWSVPGASFAVGLDGLTAWFLLPVSVVPALAAVYGLGYARPGSPQAASMRLFQGLLTAGMALLVMARNGVLFLVGWEAMALAAFFLIATEHRQAAARQAAWVYLAATHLGTACLVGVFALLAGPDGSLDWAAAPEAMPTARACAVFALALGGFGLKAGLMPFHVWLPAAHGNAPSHVSAVLSGVMIKMGIYGLLRVQALLPPLPALAGVLLLVLGALSALLGAAGALGQQDLKRMLAYSSIDNVGIVGLGLGLAALGRSLGAPELAVLGLAGALLHVLAHSLFKPLLFLAAGSVIHAAGTRELDALGGLFGRMPWTGRCFLVGAGAICGLPLLNGFAGELALYLGLFRAATAAPDWLALAAAAALAALAMVGGLALLAFVRCTAAVFLGRPRTLAAGHAHESPRAMTLPMGVLALACAAFGLLPWLLLPLLGPPLAAVLALRPDALPAPAVLLPLGSLSAVAAGCGVLLWVLWTWLQRQRPPARVPTWDCGSLDASAPRLQYTASSFAQFALQLLRWTVRERRDAPAPLELFPGPRGFAHRTLESLLHGCLWPLSRRLADRCARLRILQRGNLQIYLLYILVVLLLLLAWSAAATWSRA